tara:strand:+ start:266 stop:445 length:180 start_codon:yes stop_codon:yes gene_type:complete
MILDITKAKELGEALIDAAEATQQRQVDQAVVIIDNLAVSVPMNNGIIYDYEVAAIIKS